MSTDISISPFLIIILVYLPGYLFRKFYFSGEFTKQFSIKEWARNIGVNSFLGLFIHALVFIVIHIWFDESFEESCNHFFNNPNYNLTAENILKGNINYFILNKNDGYFLISYFTAISLFSIPFAYLIYQIVRLAKLDRKFSLFRFNNYWNYYFRGEIIDFKDFKYLKEIKSGKYWYTECDIVTQTLSGEKKMISGIIRQYTIDESGKLQNIYLSHAKKWSSREPDPENIEDFKNLNSKNRVSYQKSIEGDCFIVPYSTILELNLNYRMVQKLQITNDDINVDNGSDNIDKFNEDSKDKWTENILGLLGLAVIFSIIYYLFIFDIPDIFSYTIFQSILYRIVKAYLAIWTITAVGLFVLRIFEKGKNMKLIFINLFFLVIQYSIFILLTEGVEGLLEVIS